MGEQATQVEKRCRIEGCKRPYRAKSFCNVHYRQWRQGKLGKARFKICTKEECLGRREAMGLCKTHLEEWRAARGKGTAPAEKGEESAAQAPGDAPAEEAAEPKAESEEADGDTKESKASEESGKET